MTQHEFREALAKLRFVDCHPWMGEAFWRMFQDDPAKGFLRADDETAAKIWELIKPPEDERDAEIRDLKMSVVAFAAPSMVQWARDMDLPDNHLHPEHYDLLKRCGARMVDFKRGAFPEVEEIKKP
jgi:hypothetical protein